MKPSSTFRVLGACGLLALAVGAGCSSRDEVAPAPLPEHEPVASVRQALVASFGAGSLIIPVDTTYQNDGTLKAFGLLHALLRAGVPVRWVIKPGKAQGAADFTASAKDVKTNATIASHGYRAGPFVIDAADKAAAMAVITPWQAANTTTVHEATAPFTADVYKKLLAAPKIGVFVDGNEDIAFTYLNAAGIKDSTGQAWPLKKLGSYASYPDVLTPAALKGATLGGTPDGALLRSDGTPRYCQVTAMHYSSPADEEIVREVRAWLDSSLTHAFMECHAITAFEGAANGKFLSTAGLVSDGKAGNLTNRVPDSPFTQYDGNITATGGSVASLKVPAGSAFHASDVVLLNETNQPLTSRIMWLTGFLDGNTAKGKVSYLGGHEFSTDLPISANPQTNGVRLFLNSLFESGCAEEAKLPNITLTKSAPTFVNGSTVGTYTIAYNNAGPGVGDDAVITDVLPANTTFVSATGGGVHSGGAPGSVTWNVGNVAAGGGGSVTLTISFPDNTTISNQATLDYNASLTAKRVTSNISTTTRNDSAAVADLSVTVVSAPSPVPSAGNFMYTVTVANAGPGAAPGVTVNVTVPSNATYVSGGGGASGWTCAAPVAAVVSCTKATSIASGANDSQLVITMTAPPGPAALSGSVSTTSSSADTNGANNSVVVSTVVAGGPAPDGGGPDGGPAVIDSDGDGLADDLERRIGTDPQDADSDDDGVPDGKEPDYDQDTDGDGLINALDPDSDNDGLFDGTELGLDCSNPATRVSRHRCIPDGDKGATKTDPLNRDTDNGGASDGSEDFNLNGVVDPGETDPTAGRGADDGSVKDADGDGLSDGIELFIGSNPNDADSDDDGAPDGKEPNPSDDSDRDGLINVLDPDSDNDALWDGTELGLDCGATGTDSGRGHCIADADKGATKTSPLLRDTDRGGESDGSEDSNLNGVVDAGETDPTAGHGDDDDATIDSDDDGLSDALEKLLGSNPNDADSDDDGLPDGEEPNPGDDTDGDGKKNIVDSDSDNDGLFDGTEAGKDCSNPATDVTKTMCIADADPSTQTGVLDPDTDNGGVKDGDEDTDHDGKVDAGERDPLNPKDDVPGAGPGGGSDGGPDAASPADSGSLAGGGCKCKSAGVAGGGPASSALSFALALTVLAAARRRRRS